MKYNAFQKMIDVGENKKKNVLKFFILF